MKTGQIKKVAALDKVLQICNAHGASYNPSKASLQPTALRTLLELAQEKQEAVIVTRSAYALAINARKESFKGLPTLASQIVRMLSASKASKEDKQEAKLILRRFYPARKKKVTETPATAAEPPTGEQPVKTVRTVSRRDRDSMMSSFHELIQVVQDIPGYNPNDPEFKVETLKKKLAELRSLCQAASSSAIAYSNARIARDQVLYSAEGVVETTSEAKDYIRAKFGVRSKQSDQTRPTMNF